MKCSSVINVLIAPYGEVYLGGSGCDTNSYSRFIRGLCVAFRENTMNSIE